MVNHPTTRSRGNPIENWLACLNAVHSRVQFTFENEEDNSIAFLDCLVKELPNGKVVTSVYQKTSETNVMVKPYSCINPKTAIGTFKGYLCRAH
jgi:hypothetical protein